MELAFYLRPLLALICVLMLMAGVAWLFKKFNIGQKLISQASGKRQIFIEETHMLDMKHRLVLVRRGNVGHLILLGANTSTVIESNIALAETKPEGEQEIYGAEPMAVRL